MTQNAPKRIIWIDLIKGSLLIFICCSHFEELPPCITLSLIHIYITGSDQVWNFMRKLFPAYLLSFAPQGSRKIAYAASMGQGNIPIELHNELRKQLSDFEAISVI